MLLSWQHSSASLVLSDGSVCGRTNIFLALVSEGKVIFIEWSFLRMSALRHDLWETQLQSLVHRKSVDYILGPETGKIP
jgi:hypothetical protein